MLIFPFLFSSKKGFLLTKWLLWTVLVKIIIFKTIIKGLIVANIGLIGQNLLAFPIRIWTPIKYLCPLITFYRSFIVVINRWRKLFSFNIFSVWLKLICRIIPVIILAYRYMVVCHAEYCLKVGEKNVRDTLIRLIQCWNNFENL